MRSSDRTQILMDELRHLDKRFRRACRLVVVFNQKIADLQERYERARRDDRKSFRYTLRLQLSTTEGMRNMYYEFAARKASELENLQNQLVEEGAMSDESEDIEWDVDAPV